MAPESFLVDNIAGDEVSVDMCIDSDDIGNGESEIVLIVDDDDDVNKADFPDSLVDNASPASVDASNMYSNSVVTVFGLSSNVSTVLASVAFDSVVTTFF